MSSRDCSGVHKLIWNNHVPTENPQHTMNRRDQKSARKPPSRKKGSPSPRTECATWSSHWNLSMRAAHCEVGAPLTTTVRESKTQTKRPPLSGTSTAENTLPPLPLNPPPPSSEEFGPICSSLFAKTKAENSQRYKRRSKRHAGDKNFLIVSVANVPRVEGCMHQRHCTNNRRVRKGLSIRVALKPSCGR